MSLFASHSADRERQGQPGTALHAGCRARPGWGVEAESQPSLSLSSHHLGTELCPVAGVIHPAFHNVSVWARSYLNYSRQLIKHSSVIPAKLQREKCTLGTISSPILQPHAPTWARECFRGMAPTLGVTGGWLGLVGFLELRRQCGVSHEV